MKANDLDFIYQFISELLDWFLRNKQYEELEKWVSKFENMITAYRKELEENKQNCRLSYDESGKLQTAVCYVDMDNIEAYGGEEYLNKKENNNEIRIN